MENNFNIKEFLCTALSEGKAAEYGLKFESAPDERFVFNRIRYAKKVNTVFLSEEVSEEADLSTNESYITRKVYIVMDDNRYSEALDVFNQIMKKLKEAYSEIEADGLHLPKRVQLKSMPTPIERYNIWFCFTLTLKADTDFGSSSPDFWDNSAPSGSQGPEEIEGYEYFMVKK